MTEILNLGQSIELVGNSERRYVGSIYRKGEQTTFAGDAIVCLSNSHFTDGVRQPEVNSVFSTSNAQKAFEEFAERDDISDVMLIPQNSYTVRKPNVVNDLIRRYIHK